MKKPEGYERHSSVSEVAKLVGVTSRTVENWYASGKLPEPERTPSGMKLWSREQVNGILDWRIAQLSSTRISERRITRGRRT